MFVDFNKVFGKTPQTELKIPQALIDQLSSKLPDGFIYVVDSNNNLTISHDGKKDLKYTISGMTLEPNEQQKEILGENYSFEDILDLSYNSQKPIPVKLKNGKYVTVNGTDISIEKLSFNPFKKHKFVKDSSRIYPFPFPPAFNIQIGNGSTKIELSVKRIPNDSLDTMAFKSDDSRCLSIIYYLNPDKHFFSMTMNISLDKANTVQEIIEAIEIYNAFIEGKGYIFNSKIDARLDTTNAKMYDDEALEFWKKLHEIEQKLNVTFLPPFTNIELECIYTMEELYQNLINNVPIRKNTSINTVTSIWDETKDSIAADVMGKPIYFEFDGNSEYELFGQKITLPCIIGVFNSVFADYRIDKTKNECTVVLERESEDKEMYISTLCFFSEDEMIDYKKNVDSQSRIQLFKEAKKTSEYLIKD